MSALLAFVALFARELVRFYRQPGRVIGTLGTPLVFWLFIGAGIGRSFQSADTTSYSDFVMPGMLVLAVLFTAIFSTISIIDDRQAGFLQSVLVSPASRGSIMLSKVAAGATIGLLQALMLVGLAALVGHAPHLAQLPLLMMMLVMLGAGLTALGFLIAWYTESVQSYHGFMNMLLMPLWLLSGAVFPKEGAARPLQWLMTINPLSYGVDAVAGAFGRAWHLNDIVVVSFFTFAMLAAAWIVTLKPSRLSAG